MSRRASTTVIGAFVVGALILAAMAITIFSRGNFFTDDVAFVVYFDGSLKGLNIGAPVSFRGVRVGSVTDIRVKLDAAVDNVAIPVFISLDPAMLSTADGKPTEGETVRRIRELIDAGLRAQLRMQSLLTAQLFIELDFFPDKPVRLLNDTYPVPELPAVATPIQELGRKLDEIPIDQIVNRLHSIGSGLDRLVNSPETMEAAGALRDALREIEALAANVNSEVRPLAIGTRNTLGEIDQTMTMARRSLSRIDDVITGIDTTVARARQAIDSTGDVLAEDSPLLVNLNRTLEELRDMSRAVRMLADSLERQPDALIRGRRIREEEP